VPLSTDSFENGHVPTSALQDVTHLESFACLVAPEMATCWTNLRQAVKQQFDADLVILGGGAYRDFGAQARLFRQRYESPAVAGLPAGHYRQWNGVQYSLRNGMASAATPGTSNHGRGAAVDAAILVGGQVAAITSRADVFTWLLEHAFEYGLSWELQSEPWHLRVVRTEIAAPAVVAAPTEKEDEIVVFKTAKTGDKIFAQDANKEVRHISGFEGAVAEAANPGWATKVTLLAVTDDVAMWLNSL
jgi:D-alanyl-D-alanine dipeptidase